VPRAVQLPAAIRNAVEALHRIGCK
jgi:hypothetical protein